MSIIALIIIIIIMIIITKMIWLKIECFILWFCPPLCLIGSYLLTLLIRYACNFRDGKKKIFLYCAAESHHQAGASIWLSYVWMHLLNSLLTSGTQKAPWKSLLFISFFLMLHFHYNYNFPPLLYQRQPRLLLPILLNPISRYVGRFSN